MNKHCKQCGTEAHPTALFCQKCGTKIKDDKVKAKVPIKKRQNKLAVAVLSLAVAMTLGSLIGWLAVQSNRATYTNNAREYAIGEKFTLSNGKSIKIVSAQVTDKVGGERQLVVKVEYDNPNLDQLSISLYNNGERVTERHYSQLGSLEYKGLNRDLARAGYALVFDGGESVKLSDISYSEVPNDSISDQGISNGKEFEPLNTPASLPTTNNGGGNPNPSNLQCNTYDSGYGSSTNCYTY